MSKPIFKKMQEKSSKQEVFYPLSIFNLTTQYVYDIF